MDLYACTSSLNAPANHYEVFQTNCSLPFHLAYINPLGTPFFEIIKDANTHCFTVAGELEHAEDVAAFLACVKNYCLVAFGIDPSRYEAFYQPLFHDLYLLYHNPTNAAHRADYKKVIEAIVFFSDPSNEKEKQKAQAFLNFIFDPIRSEAKSKTSLGIWPSILVRVLHCVATSNFLDKQQKTDLTRILCAYSKHPSMLPIVRLEIFLALRELLEFNDLATEQKQGLIQNICQTYGQRQQQEPIPNICYSDLEKLTEANTLSTFQDEIAEAIKNWPVSDETVLIAISFLSHLQGVSEESNDGFWQNLIGLWRNPSFAAGINKIIADLNDPVKRYSVLPTSASRTADTLFKNFVQGTPLQYFWQLIVDRAAPHTAVLITVINFVVGRERALHGIAAAGSFLVVLAAELAIDAVTYFLPPSNTNPLQDKLPSELVYSSGGHGGAY